MKNLKLKCLCVRLQDCELLLWLAYGRCCSAGCKVQSPVYCHIYTKYVQLNLSFSNISHYPLITVSQSACVCVPGLSCCLSAQMKHNGSIDCDNSCLPVFMDKMTLVWLPAQAQQGVIFSLILLNPQAVISTFPSSSLWNFVSHHTSLYHSSLCRVWVLWTG